MFAVILVLTKNLIGFRYFDYTNLNNKIHQIISSKLVKL